MRLRSLPHVPRNMALVVPLGFSPDGEYFACSSADGTLKIWDTATGKLRQEYTPSSHLSATCTCLSWAPKRRASESPPKKKKRRSSAVALDNLELVALGTSSGTLLLYSVVKGSLHTQLEEGHAGAVNGLSWADSDSVYSCSDDNHIIQWDTGSATVKHKWKGDKHGVYSICVLSGGGHLLSASRTIKLWDLTTHQVIRKFTGHATEVFRLLHVPLPHPPGVKGQAEGSYFLSAALNDRLVNAWQYNTESTDKNAVASFLLPETPTHLELAVPTQENQNILLAVVTKAGQVLVYEHVLNGRLKKPVKPKVTLQIATDSKEDRLPRPLPIICVQLHRHQSTDLRIAHGNTLKPVFESLPYTSLESETCLVRADPLKSLAAVKVDTSVSTVKTPVTSDEVTVLAPGHMAPSKPQPSGSSSSGKKRRTSTSEMSMAERLNAMSIKQPSAKSHPPRTDTLATLLTQGLQSQDSQIINNVLQQTNETVIRNTVKRLPVSVIVPLVEELCRRMHKHAQSGYTSIKWVRTVVTVHTAYLISFPELVETLSGIYQMIDSRVSMFSRLSRLQGKLDLMLRQVAAQTQEDDGALADQQAVLTYQDESSSDELEMEDLVNDHADSDDENWEDMMDGEEAEASSASGSDDDDDNDEEDENGMDASDASD